MAKNQLKKPGIKTSKINPKATIPDESRHEYPVFSFLHVCERHCLLSEWQGQELIELVNAFKKMESVKWNQLFDHPGLNYEKIHKYSKPPPPQVSPDVTVYGFRVSEKKRVFGYRAGNVFRILWFDRNHEVTPYHKQRRK